MQWRSPPKTDDEFVETVRKSVTRFDRLRTWSIVLLGLIPLLPVVILLIVLMNLAGMLDILAKGGGNPNAPLAWAGFALGALMGWWVGQSIHSALTQMAQITSGYRTERLLLRYYDAYQEHCGEESSSVNHDDDPEDRHSSCEFLPVNISPR
jgi:hypothetical protein